jgi:transcriptional regulator with XRE-family HTH domain
MRREGRERSLASKDVIALREELGLSQARFAAEVMNLSWASIAKYETTHPPKGEQLLRLMEAALTQAKRFPEPKASVIRAIANRFKILYRHELVAAAKPSVDVAHEITGRLAGGLQEILKKAQALPKVTQADVDDLAKALREWVPISKELLAMTVGVKKYLDQAKDLEQRYTRALEKEWHSTGVTKSGGTSSNSAASRSAKARTRKAARKR